jgi:CBS domain-containing protein
MRAGSPRALGSSSSSALTRAYERSKKFRLVRDIMSRDVVTIAPEASMAEAARLMGERHIGSLIVMKYATPVGMVTERDLLSSVLALGRVPREVKVESVMSYPLPKINPKASIKEAAQTMIKKRRRLAVFEDGDLVGVVTASDLIRSLPLAPETTLRVDEFMTMEVVTVDEKTTVASVAKIMGEKRIGSVIVTQGGKPAGIFTERDLLTNFLANDRPLDVPMGENASSPLITVPSGTSVHEAASIMALKHIRRLPITEGGKIVGIITTRDLVEAYAK